MRLKKSINSDCLSELKNYCKIGLENPSFMKCYGISRNIKGNYILVLKYAEIGSLYQNISKIVKIDWKDKLNLLFSITSDLKAIHSQGIVHRDLHSGNILQDNLHSAYIADLGLSIQCSKQSDNRVCGVLPYVDPKILNGGRYATSSDIYSFGMIMWGILYGISITYDTNFSEKQLQLKICNGLRPSVNKEAPQCYVNLMKQCWDHDPKKRPTIQELWDIFKEWQDDETILSQLNDSKIIFKCMYKKFLCGCSWWRKQGHFSHQCKLLY